MIRASGVRIGWADLPSAVRAGVEQVLGSPVVSAISQSAGFSPGTADRVVTASGTRAFVKAVSPAQNEVSPGMHRKEIAVTMPPPAHLPDAVAGFERTFGGWQRLDDDPDPHLAARAPWAAQRQQWLLDGDQQAMVVIAGNSLVHQDIRADNLDAVAVLTASLGYFLDAARKPPPPGLPTVRSFQQAQADALLGWLPELAD